MSHLLQVLLLLSLVTAAAKLAGAAAVRAGQPAVFGELLAGVILGPTILNVLGWPLFAPLPAHAGSDSPGPLLGLLTDLSDVGVILLMLVAGLETDLDQMRRVGVAAFWSAAGGVVVPMIGGILVASAFGMPVLPTGLFIGTILTATSVSISAQVLMELGVLRSKVGSTILGAAVIDDVMGIVVFSVIVAVSRASGGVSAAELGLLVVRIAVFFGGAIWVGRHFDRILEWGDRLDVSQGLLATVALLAFAYAFAAEYVGSVAAITGSYLAGVLLTRTRFRKRIDEGVHPLTYSILVPVFVITIGLRANGRDLGTHAGFTVILILVAIAGKIAGSGLSARACGYSNLESLRVGIGMVSRGEVGLIIAGYGLAHGIVDGRVFAASVVTVLATTMVTPPLLRLVYPRAPRAPGPTGTPEFPGGIASAGTDALGAEAAVLQPE